MVISGYDRDHMANELDESRLIEAIQAGSLDQFAPLYNQYAEAIYRYVFYRVRHKETAEDLTSTIFMKALEKIGSFDAAKGSFNSWVYRIAHNTVIDHFRSTGRSGEIAVDPDETFAHVASDDEGAEEAAIRREDIADLNKRLEKLSGDQREIVIMRVWDEKPFKEIAEVLGKTEAAAKMMFYRAISALSKVVALAMQMVPHVLILVMYLV